MHATQHVQLLGAEQVGWAAGQQEAGRHCLAPDCPSWTPTGGMGLSGPHPGLTRVIRGHHSAWGEIGEKTFMKPASDCSSQAFVLDQLSCLCWWAALACGFINCLSIARVLSLWITVDQLKSAWKCKKEMKEEEEEAEEVVWKYSSLPCVTVERQIACLRRHLYSAKLLLWEIIMIKGVFFFL